MTSSSPILFFLLLIGFVVFLVNRLFESGTFSTTKNFNVESCQVIGNFAGPEDIQYDSENDILFISSKYWGKSNKETTENTGIFILDLKTKDAKPKLVSNDAPINFKPHGIHLYKDSKTGEKSLFVVNDLHPPTVEVFDVIDNETIKHRETFSNPNFISLNEVVGVGKRSFYVSQDSKYFHNKLLLFFATLFGFEKGTLFYYDGSNWKSMINDIHFVNGLALSPDKKTLYLGETNKLGMRIYERNIENGNLKFKEFIHLKAGPDNINTDPQGNLWVAGFPNLLATLKHLKDKNTRSPVNIIKITMDGNKVAEIEKVLTSSGENISGITTAEFYKDQLFFISGLMNSELRLCNLPKDIQIIYLENVDL